ncbi:MAG TPA: FAD-dependent oxidoreductase [Desulfuromonadales bacterium]|nr:FAD-dependent oxidoreductase [Desulfuromonadales bacterium]
MKRQQLIAALQKNRTFDLLVIGGGATGCGVALDAASRGLQTVLVEKNDFAEGTSSRSTKLLHGGVRYLEMAVKRLDRNQYHLVRDGLRERGILLRNAPHLAARLPLVTPLYKWYEVPYIFAGLKLYDLLAGSRSIGHSRLVGRKKSLSRYPLLKAEGLKAAVLYYDGQFHDARMAVTLAGTAHQQGATVANHLEVLALLKQNGKVCGARVRDHLGGGEFAIHARGVVNATGPFADRVRQMDDPGAQPILKASSGIHIVLDKRFAPPQTGVMIPETEDGRILFILPWEGHALVGTTDEPAAISDHPRPQAEEIRYLLRHISTYFDTVATDADIRSAWSGLRPLVFDPETTDTAKLTRDHIIEVSTAKLLTIAGGKWTTYRKMAQETVDHALATFGLDAAKSCHTDRLPLLGAANFKPAGTEELAKTYGLDADIAHHLHHAYGDQASKVAELARQGLGRRLHAEHPFLQAEVLYAVRHEFAQRPLDVLVRRTALALVDNQAAQMALPRVIELMAEELAWDEKRQKQEIRLAMSRLEDSI